MADLPKYYSGLINIEAQDGSTIHMGNINHYTAQGDVRTYDFSHMIPEYNSNEYLEELELHHPPIKESFMLMLDGVVLSPKFALPDDSDVTADYEFVTDKKIKFLFQDGLRKQSPDDTPVLLARYSRR